jgi:hypothetical protein
LKEVAKKQVALNCRFDLPIDNAHYSAQGGWHLHSEVHQWRFSFFGHWATLFRIWEVSSKQTMGKDKTMPLMPRTAHAKNFSGKRIKHCFARGASKFWCHTSL